VYAVGLLLFELLTGRKAFPGGDPLRVAYDHVHSGAPDVRDVAPTVPDPVAELVRRACATDPGDRHPDAYALLQEMRALLRTLDDEDLDVVAAPDPDRRLPTGELAGRPGGDLTQLMGAQAGSSTRRIPVARPAGDGHYARTTGNRRPLRRRGAAGWILGLLLVGLLAGGGYAFWYLTEGPAVHSPRPVVVGLTETDAREALDGEDLDPVVEPAYSEEVPAGVVISADHAPGLSLPHGTDVGLVVSQGPERYAVPPVAGLSLDSAAAALESANLVLGEQAREHDEVEPEGRVLRSSPEPGASVPPGTPVDVVVSAGPAPVDVPDVTGRTQQDATQALVGAGLTVTVAPERVHDDTVPDGSVVSQSPTSGAVQRGTTVTLVLSKGPELVTVPQVVGRQFSAAERELTELGLVVVREDVRGGFFGTVREQSVEPGEEVPPGTEVVLVVV
jgi:serine/threonine-protein kinase